MVHVTGITQKFGIIKGVVVYCWSAGTVVIRLLASSWHSGEDGSWEEGVAEHFWYIGLLGLLASVTGDS
jgi:hypothetical protein